MRGAHRRARVLRAVHIVNLILTPLTGIAGLASLPLYQAGIMILVSVVLTLVSGLIPASAAAKKDPVIALRTE